MGWGHVGGWEAGRQAAQWWLSGTDVPGVSEGWMDQCRGNLDEVTSEVS